MITLNCYVCTDELTTDTIDTDVETGYILCRDCYYESILNENKIYELGE